MLIHDSCQSAIQYCLDTKTFSIARLYNGEKTMGIHLHGCYEIYFSIAGGEQFCIDNRVYEVQPGDVFFINPFESHYLSKVDEASHERIVMSIYPEYLKGLSTPQTDLNGCFMQRDSGVGHKISLTKKEQHQFIYFINKMSGKQGFGQDVLDEAAFLEMMCFLNGVFLDSRSLGSDLAHIASKAQHCQTDEILSYINRHLTEDLNVPMLADHFYLSTSHFHKVFKTATGTTVNRYITAKRIARAKAMLSEGRSVLETGNLCGFKNYSNFFRAFTKLVGLSPRKYIECTRNETNFI